jgi:hypothetical protein
MFHNKKIAVRAIFSSQNECSINFFPSEKNDMEVYLVKYPVQLSLFSGIGLGHSNISLNVPYEEALIQYAKATPMFRFGKDDIHMTVENLTLSTPFPKVFTFAKNSIAILEHVSIELRQSDDTNPPRQIIPYVALLTGERDFSFAIDKGKELGQELAEQEIRELFISSKFFRQALVYEKLIPVARDISNKVSRAQKDPSFEYPYWQFKKDVEKLKELALQSGTDATFIGELFRDQRTRPHDGFLLWYYPDYLRFSIQWAVINVVLFAGSVILYLLRNKHKFGKLL